MTTKKFKPPLETWTLINDKLIYWKLLTTKLRYDDDSFINTKPETIRIAASIRIAVAGSPNMKIPTKKEPIAPIPVQIV